MARSPLMHLMIKAADKAARGLRRDFNEIEHLQVSRKGAKDFVTYADLTAEQVIKEELKVAGIEILEVDNFRLMNNEVSMSTFSDIISDRNSGRRSSYEGDRGHYKKEW